MLILLKKSSIILMLLSFLLGTTSVYIIKDTKIKNTFATTLTNRVFVIDAGHGGKDGGASSEDGTYERDINLKIAHYLREILQTNGSIVYMTREDKDILNGERFIKKKDMVIRKDRINSVSPDIVISIHLNKFSESQYRGAQVFYSDSSDNSRILAEIIRGNIIKLTYAGNDRKVKKLPDDKFLFKNLKYPCVVVECGFLSNLEDVALLKDEGYQKTLALSIFSGLDEYFDKYYE